MAHICHLMVADFQESIGRYDERGDERYCDRNLENAIIYCEDYLDIGVTHCPVQGWSLEAMLVWASARLAEHRELEDAR